MADLEKDEAAEAAEAMDASSELHKLLQQIRPKLSAAQMARATHLCTALNRWAHKTVTHGGVQHLVMEVERLEDEVKRVTLSYRNERLKYRKLRKRLRKSIDG